MLKQYLVALAAGVSLSAPSLYLILTGGWH